MLFFLVGTKGKLTWLSFSMTNLQKVSLSLFLHEKWYRLSKTKLQNKSICWFSQILHLFSPVSLTDLLCSIELHNLMHLFTGGKVKKHFEQ